MDLPLFITLIGFVLFVGSKFIGISMVVEIAKKQFGENYENKLRNLTEKEHHDLQQLVKETAFYPTLRIVNRLGFHSFGVGFVMLFLTALK